MPLAHPNGALVKDVTVLTNHSASSVCLPVGLAWQTALEHMGGDLHSFLKLLDLFPQGLSDLLTSMAASLEAQDRPTAIRCLHTLKGLSKTFGADALAALSQALERRALAAAEDQPLPVTNAEHEQIRALAHQATLDAQRLLEQLRLFEPGPQIDRGATLAQLRQLLMQSNLDALEVFLRLDPVLTQRAPETHLALCQALQRLDFQEALGHCDALARANAS